MDDGSQEPSAEMLGDLTRLPESDQRFLHRIRRGIVVAEDAMRGGPNRGQMGTHERFEALQTAVCSVLHGDAPQQLNRSTLPRTRRVV
ncbi:MAG: hypothetical protein QNK03_21120 [Myxococcota bacterium]|nr:hypothetical protein [Myxococcota bacterium]